jgi:cellulose synthase/poly-beta-1,6-N-acetylglucosamine synthase-like glycosyltransferase
MTSYALITAAHNEEAYIGKTLSSVTSQTVLPAKWIIVSDGSTDRTDEIVRRYAREFAFIHLLRREKHSPRDFASKVFALNAAMKMIENEDYPFVGHLDADISFGPNYFFELFRKFEEDPLLGLAGGFIYEEVNGRFMPIKGNRIISVAGAVQMFRQECYRDVGPFLPIPYGGEDWYAEVVARMRGWRVKSFPDLVVRHHRITGSANGTLRSWYRAGLMDHALGCHPVFEVTRLVRRVFYRPLFIGALVRFASFALASLRQEKRMVSPEFVSFLRKEEMGRLQAIKYSHFWATELKSRLFRMP